MILMWLIKKINLTIWTTKLCKKKQRRSAVKQKIQLSFFKKKHEKESNAICKIKLRLQVIQQLNQRYSIKQQTDRTIKQ